MRVGGNGVARDIAPAQRCADVDFEFDFYSNASTRPF